VSVALQGESPAGAPTPSGPTASSPAGGAGATAAFIAPGATLGVIGGGQLGRMFAQVAQRMGYRTVVLDPDRASPAGLIAHRHVEAGYLDREGLAALADEAVAVTTEFENVPAEALVELARSRRVAPSGAAVSICQDRAAEKAHFVRCGVACAPHAVLERAEHLALPELDGLLPGILKTARLGYDGKGQARVRDRAELAAAWDRHGRTTCVLERLLPLAVELSVIVARGFDGRSVVLPVQQNLHRDGILAVTRVPAPDVSLETAGTAVDAAQRVAASMDYVGVLCVEFFVLADGTLVANEMAPRPHNSGHYSLDACDLSQFELQVRALSGAPLVAPRLHSPAVMLNLLGDLWWRGERGPIEPDWAAVLVLPGVHLHLYGKAAPRAGRKMGHLTVTGASPAAAEQTARAAAAALGIEGW
jgi:5-(carboxyamino)imidazole ribonucleotide synthase